MKKEDTQKTYMTPAITVHELGPVCQSIITPTSGSSTEGEDFPPGLGAKSNSADFEGDTEDLEDE